MLHALMKTELRCSVLLALAITLCCAPPLHGYGPIGHELVGAIADERLAGTAAGEQVKTLLNGITLLKASVIADEIKGWDKKGVDDPKAFHYSSHPAIDAQLSDFWRANPPTHDTNAPNPSHHWFHYTDVPVVRAEKYADGKIGRNKWDVVHMIPYCVDVLRGRIPEQNERKITKPIAVILLAHFVGDIHQPLHVGAEYFNNSGQIVDPDKTAKPSLADEGGNTLFLDLADDPPRTRGKHKRKFHGFWDQDSVNMLFPELPETMPKEERRAQSQAAQKKLAHELATHEPKNWKLASTVDLGKYAEAWADEILPVAREAHERIIFRNIQPLQEEDRIVASGDVEEKSGSEPGAYRKWAAGIVREELHKAGWRLADLLEKSLQNSGPASPH